MKAAVSRAALYILTAALAVGTFGALFVVGVEQATVAALSGQVNELTNELGQLKQEMTRVQAENAAVRDSDRHIAVALRENRLYLMQGADPIRVVAVATGSGRKFWAFGKQYEFVTPPGVYSILKKDTEPVWIAPDWYWHEKGETVPENLTLEQRSFKGVMGQYALRLGDGYAIHGTNEPWSIGRYATHGCIRVGAKDLEVLYQSVDTGTRVYIY